MPLIIPPKATVIHSNYLKQNRNQHAQDLSHIQIRDGVTIIEENAFSHLVALESVSIPQTVVEIGAGAFSGCTRLKTVTLMNGITRIGRGAFSGCTSLQSIDIPASVKVIGYGAFFCCTSLTSVSFPKSIVEIGENVFCGCPSLRTITIHLYDKKKNSSTNEVTITPQLGNLFEKRKTVFPKGKQTAWLEDYKKVLLPRIKPLMEKKYEWKGKDEINTINTFNRYSLLLNHAIAINDHSALIACILKILEWGGVDQQWTAIVPDFYGVLSNPSNRALLQQCDYNMATEMGRNKQDKDRIASWSKILAAFMPGTYCIYDSRVANALSSEFEKAGKQDYWTIPSPRGGNLKKGQYDVPECYYRYHTLLQSLAGKQEVKKTYRKDVDSSIREAYSAVGFSEEQAIMAHLEKVLFMLGEN